MNEWHEGHLKGGISYMWKDFGKGVKIEVEIPDIIRTCNVAVKIRS